jgi:hypothetical protein
MTLQEDGGDANENKDGQCTDKFRFRGNSDTKPRNSAGWRSSVTPIVPSISIDEVHDEEFLTGDCNFLQC